MKLDDLKQASDLGEDLAAIERFIAGLQGWGGLVDLSFGSYHCASSATGPIMQILESERVVLRDRLTVLGVDLS